MGKLIACCGINCASCDARIATINNDDELRNATAGKWGTDYNAPAISPGMINCTVCREEGVKFSHYEVCEIRKCVRGRGYETCGDCRDMKTCNIVSAVFEFVHEAKLNLRNLN